MLFKLSKGHHISFDELMKSALLAAITSFNLENDWLQKFERIDVVKMYSQRKKLE